MRYIALLVLILLVSIGVRFHAIDRFSTGWDEQFSVLEANGLDPSLIEGTGTFTRSDLVAFDNLRGVRDACMATDGGNGILYIMGLHAWTSMFGNGNMAIRLFSLFMGCIVVLLIHGLALMLFEDRNTALLAAFMAALSPILVDFSQEARAYMMATAFSLWATIVYVQLLRLKDHSTDRTLFLRYGLLASASLLSHYYTGYIFFGHALHALLHLRSRHRSKQALGALLVAMCMVGIWMFFGGLEGMTNMGKQQDLYRSIVEAEPDYDEFFRAATPANLIQDSVVQLLWLCGNALHHIGPSIRYLALLLAFPLALAAGFLFSKAQKRNGEWSLLLILSLAGSAQSVIVSAWAGHNFGMRYYYAIFSAPYILLLIAAGARKWWARGGWFPRTVSLGSLTAIIIIMFASVVWLHRHGYRGNSGPERIMVAAEAMSERVRQDPHARYTILHADQREALTLNLHLDDRLDQIPQRIDPELECRAALILHTDSGDHTVFELVR